MLHCSLSGAFISVEEFVKLYTFCRASQVALVVMNPPASAGDVRDADSIPGSRSPGVGNGTPLQYFCLENLTLKPLIVWITTNCGKFLKRWEYQTTIAASRETCMQVKKQQLELDMEQQTGSKLGTEYIKAVYCHPAYLTYMQSSVQFRSVAQSCPTLCDPMDCRPGLGFPVHHQLLDLAQTHVHCVSDAIQPSHPLSSPSPPVFSLSQHQGLFQWVSSLHQVARVLEFQLQHQSFQWIFKTDFL